MDRDRDRDALRNTARISINELLTAAKHRHLPRVSRYRSRSSNYTIYELAKKAETEERNLQKALLLYVESAKKG